MTIQGTKRGFSLLIVLLVLAIIAALGVGYLSTKSPKENTSVGTGQDYRKLLSYDAPFAVYAHSDSDLPHQICSDDYGPVLQELVREVDENGTISTTTIISDVSHSLQSAAGAENIRIDGALWPIVSSSETNSTVFFGEQHCGTEGGLASILSYDIKTGNVKKLPVASSLLQGHSNVSIRSSDKTKFVVGQNNTELWVVDLLSDTKTLLLALPAGEFLQLNPEDYHPSPLHWTDNHTLEYDVYDTSSLKSTRTVFVP